MPSFREDGLPQRLRAIARAVAAGAAVAIRQEAHALKGAAAEVCAPAVAEAAEGVEAASAVADPGQLREKYETLEREMHKLSESLRAFARS